MLTDVFNSVFGGGTEDQNTLQSTFEQIPTKITEWLSTLGDTLNTNLVQPFSDKVTEVWDWLSNPEKEGSLASKFANLPNTVKDWFGGLKAALTDFFYDPFNGVIKQVLSLFGLIGDKIAELLGIFHSGADSGDVPTPSVPMTTYGASGAQLRAGQLSVVGEKGWEFFKPKMPGEVISHANSLKMMKSMSVRPTIQYTPPPVMVPQPVVISDYGGRGDSTVNQNFYGPANARSVRRAVMEARAMGAM
jgi:hypothetical protein